MFHRIRRTTRRRTVAGLLSLALLSLIAVPTVAAADPSPGPGAGAPNAASVAARFGHPRLPFLRGVVRADFTIVKRDGTTVLVHYERGEITALSDTSITITGRDGKGATFVVTSDTRVREKGRPAEISDLEVGDRAMVFGTNDGGTYTAVLISCVLHPPASSSAPATPAPAS